MFYKTCRYLFLLTIISTAVLFSTVSFTAPKKKNVLTMMKKASDFMMNTASYRGGFLWNYSENFSQQWGEIPARKTQIWVQGATNNVGEMFLEVYHVTDDPEYLDYARRVANAIIWGQYPSGGWHYLIDFDMTGIQKWYNEVASKCWGWEELSHYYGNCTFDDDTTTGSIRFLMHLYMTTLDPAYHKPLLKGLDFVLKAQFPNGAWPQRYPLRYEFVKDGIPDYTSHYTFNDNVIYNCIMTLLEAYEKLGNEEYKKEALKGMDFHIISQLGKPQAGWANAYSHDLKPAQERTYEPAGVNVLRTISNIRALETFYKITGDRRYLKPIPAAVSWLENLVKENGGQLTTRHYEIGTNRPIYSHTKGTNIENGRFYQSYELSPTAEHFTVDIDQIKNKYARVSALNPDEARKEYEREKNARELRYTHFQINSREIESIIKSLDKRGAWVTDVNIRNYDQPHDPGTIIKGIATRNYINNMYKLLFYYKSLNEK